jgi:hypothetical protein
MGRMGELGSGVIEGTTRLTVSDFEGVFRVLPVAKRLRFVASWMLAGLGAGAMTWALVGMGAIEAGAISGLPLVSLVVLMPGAYLLLSNFGPVSAPAMARRALDDVGQNLEFRFDEDGVQFKTDDARIDLAWSAVGGFQELRDSFLVYVAPQRFHLVPKRALRGDELTRLSELLADEAHPNRPDAPRYLPPSTAKRLGKTVGLWLLLVFGFVCVWQFLDDAKGTRDTQEAP